MRGPLDVGNNEDGQMLQSNVRTGEQEGAVNEAIEFKTTAKRGQSQGGRRGLNHGQFATVQQHSVKPTQWGFANSSDRPSSMTNKGRYTSLQAKRNMRLHITGGSQCITTFLETV